MSHMPLHAVAVRAYMRDSAAVKSRGDVRRGPLGWRPLGSQSPWWEQVRGPPQA